MILAALAAEFCNEIDLINVCFGNGQSPDRKTAIQGKTLSIVCVFMSNSCLSLL